MYAKGVRYFEDEPVADATIDDIDLDFVWDYCKKIRYSKSAEEYLRENKKFITVKDGKERVSVAAILLFGKKPQDYFPRAFIRFIRYDGTEAKVGKDMNVVKDVIFEGRILDQIEKAVDYIKIQMKEKTYLGHDGIFVTEEEYNEFVRTEIVVNAVTHRDYGIKGTDIQIKMFDDRLEVDSPGTFAGMVKKENIRYTHFSRNPKIAAFLKDYDYVKEYGEGVDRMCKELEAVGLPDPVFDNNTFILKTTIKSAAYQKLPIDVAKLADSDQNLPVDNAKVADSVQNGNIENQNPLIKLSMESFIQMYSDKGYNEPTRVYLQAIYDQIEVNQIFGSTYIMKILNCSERTARNLLTKLKDIGAVVTVTGKGKGMYRFKYTDEI
jgi:ATP-dependent DNA helicase RecG